MGRIKSKAIKKTAKTLVARTPEFSVNFEKNKELLKIYNLPDIGTRNKIAGYISRIKRNKKAG
ncbi:MAG: 30S ribosomal protein S17e [Candidatus Pacearchaeota archaeon]